MQSLGFFTSQVRRLPGNLLHGSYNLCKSWLPQRVQEGRAGACVPAVRRSYTDKTRRSARRGRGAAHRQRLQGEPSEGVLQQVFLEGVQGQGDGAGQVRRMRCQFLPEAPTPHRSRLHRGGGGVEAAPTGGAEQAGSNDNIAEQRQQQFASLP